MKPESTRSESFLRRLREDGIFADETAHFPDLDAWADPVVDPAHMARVMALLHPPQPRTVDRARFALTLLRAQTRVVRRGVWLASALSFALGALVTVALYASTETVLLALVAPLAAACGIAFVFGPDVDPPLEVLLTTHVSPRQVLLARLVLVFGFDLALGVAVTALLSGLLPLSLGLLLTTWLAPMAFLSSLAFCGSVFFADSLSGVMLSLCAWFVMCVGYLGRADAHVSALLPDFTLPASQLPLWAAALAFGIIAFWLSGLERHWLRQ